MYDHNVTAGVRFYMYTGANNTAGTRRILPGDDDQAVAYHSAGGVAGSTGRQLCNAGAWRCPTLSIGNLPNEDRSVKWTNHFVLFRDDAYKLDHYSSGTWQGVPGKVREGMAAISK
jgi:hypothetical protein